MDYGQGNEHGVPMVIGGETVQAKDTFLQTITNVFYKINAAAENKTKITELAWSLDFNTDILISYIINATDRDNFFRAKEAIYQAECIKRSPKRITRYEDILLLSPDDRDTAKVAACTIIIGEVRQYLDKYFGFETKLSVML